MIHKYNLSSSSKDDEFMHLNCVTFSEVEVIFNNA